MTSNREQLQVYIESQMPKRPEAPSHIETIRKLKTLLKDLKSNDLFLNSFVFNFEGGDTKPEQVGSYLENMARQNLVSKDLELFNLSFRFSSLFDLKSCSPSVSKLVEKTSPETEVTLQVLEDEQTQMMGHDELYEALNEQVVFLRSSHSKRKIVVDYLIAPFAKERAGLEGTREFFQRTSNNEFQLTNSLVSYMTKNSNVGVLEQILFWKEYFQNYLSAEQAQELIVPVFEKTKSLLGRMNLLAIEDEIYLQPELYSRIPYPLERFKLNVRNYAELTEKKEQLESRGFAYSASTRECSSCSLLHHCVQRGTLSVMEELQETECVYPETLKQAFRS